MEILVLILIVAAFLLSLAAAFGLVTPKPQYSLIAGALALFFLAQILQGLPGSK